MKYSFTSRIRYSEIGEDGNLTLPGLINYFQDFHTAFQVRSFYDNPAVKTAWTQQRRVKNLRAVCGRKDQNTLGAVESVHLGEELV